MTTSGYLGENAHLWLFGWLCPPLVIWERMPSSGYLGENAHLWLFGWGFPPLVIWERMPTSGYLGEDAHLWLLGWGCPPLVTWVRMGGQDGRGGQEGWRVIVNNGWLTEPSQWIYLSTWKFFALLSTCIVQAYKTYVYINFILLQQFFMNFFYSCSYSNIPVTSCPEAN